MYDPSEHFPPQIRLQLLQNAVRPIDDLRVVKALDKHPLLLTMMDQMMKYSVKLQVEIHIWV